MEVWLKVSGSATPVVPVIYVPMVATDIVESLLITMTLESPAPNASALGLMNKARDP